ncbi:MAG: PP2C family protein-serine/threonine phosphatase [Planctomycetota bacterium]|jgi:serine phosphatase RsbU (regulator of sigma subunit)
MVESESGDMQNKTLRDLLSVGFAIADVANWKIELANQRFHDWFLESSDGASLKECLEGLNEERARKKLDKGRSYVIETEQKSGARRTTLQTTIRKTELDGRQVIVAETKDCTKQKEQEHMLDSFANLADHNKKQLESANQALAEKTEEITKAYQLIKAQNNRMERELEVARQVQLNMLPTDFMPTHMECTVAGTLKPALEVGGDFFDFFYLDKDRLCFLVGDVSDKGAASGLFMAASKTLIKAHASRAESTAGIVSRVNSELSINNDTCMFVTLFLAIIDLQTGEVVLTNAGHNPPFKVCKSGKTEWIKYRNGPALGIKATAKYTEASIKLDPGDMFVVYSDGVTEAMNKEDEMFGNDRLIDLFNRDGELNASSAVRSIAEAVEEFEVGTHQSDDVTVIAVTYHGV